MEDLRARIAELDASIKLLTEDIAENNEKVAEITAYKKTETELRNENHEEILATIKDAQDGQAAIEQAIAVLKEFYKNSGEITKEPFEFIQIQESRIPDSPDTWDSSYSGVSDGGSSGAQ